MGKLNTDTLLKILFWGVVISAIVANRRQLDALVSRGSTASLLYEGTALLRGNPAQSY